MSDILYKEAKKIVIKSQKASISFLQRKLMIGYARASDLLDILEDEDVIGPYAGHNPRKVLTPNTH